MVRTQFQAPVPKSNLSIGNYCQLNGKVASFNISTSLLLRDILLEVLYGLSSGSLDSAVFLQIRFPKQR